MSTGPKTRFTIGNLMVVVAGVALTIAVMVTPGLGRMAGAVVVLGLIVVVSTVLGVRRIMELIHGKACPNCQVRGLERRAILSFGERFYSCPSCGLRCRRSLLGLHNFFLWKDASGREYDALYAKPALDDPWNAPPGLEDEDLIYSKTHLNLVQNKRRRSPENPNGPGLE